MFRWVVAAIVTIVVLVIVGSVGDRAATDTELAARVGDRLAAEGLGWVETEVTGRDVHIAGGTASEAERDKALTVVRSTPGVRDVNDRMEVLEAASPYGFSVTRDGERTVATGYQPSSRALERVRSELTAAFGDGLDASGLTAASGAPANYRTAVAASISAAELLESGKVSIDGTVITIVGVAKDEDDYEALTSGGSIDVPQGYTLGSETVTKPDPAPSEDGADPETSTQ
tara:strand:+ start:286 stop:975 length:690 start_codon:yes stop_codon:yes gene_type:complete